MLLPPVVVVEEVEGTNPAVVPARVVALSSEEGMEEVEEEEEEGCCCLSLLSMSKLMTHRGSGDGVEFDLCDEDDDETQHRRLARQKTCGWSCGLCVRVQRTK